MPRPTLPVCAAMSAYLCRHCYSCRRIINALCLINARVSSVAAHQRDKIYGKRGHKHGYGKQHCPQP